MVETQKIKPQAGRQEQFLSSSADIVIYGGAAGGGKSWGLLMEPLRHITSVPGFGAVIFRRNTTQIRNEGGLWDESKKLYPLTGAIAKEATLEYIFPPYGNKVKFAHLEHENTVLNWQGSQIALIGFDELTHFVETQFWYMLSRNRSTCGVSPYVRAGTNPDPDSWVRRLIDWWIGEDGFPIQERAGVLRWFIRVNGELVWGDTKQELLTKFPESQPKSLTFIPSKLEDNQILMRKDPAYKSNLMALSKVDRARLLDGNWNIRPSSGDYFKRDWFRITNTLPNDVTQWVRYWDRAATEPSQNSPDPDWTVGVLMGKRKTGEIIIADIKRDRLTPAGVEALYTRVTKHDAETYQNYASWHQTDPGQAGKVEAHHISIAMRGHNVRFDPVPKVNKLTRVLPLSAYAEAGNVSVLNAVWNEAFFSELEALPDAGHDDQADAAAGAFNVLSSTRKIARARTR